MVQLNVGDNSASAQNIVHVGVSRGEAVTIENLDGGVPLNVYSDLNQSPATLDPGKSKTVKVPAWLQSTGIATSVRLSGGIYD